MDVFHRVAGVAARAAGQVAQLLGERALDALQPGVLKGRPREGIGRHPIDQPVGDRGDSRLAAQAHV